MNYVIRKAKAEDLDKLFPLVEEFVTSFNVNFESFKYSFEIQLAEKNSLILVIEKDGNLIGYCLGYIHHTFYANGKVAWLEEIMVKSSYKRQRLGSELIANFEEWAKEHGAILTALATRRASPFYSSIGYEESATYYRKIL